jgi:hypothetical protein
MNIILTAINEYDNGYPDPGSGAWVVVIILALALILWLAYGRRTK